MGWDSGKSGLFYFFALIVFGSTVQLTCTYFGCFMSIVQKVKVDLSTDDIFTQNPNSTVADWKK